MPLYFDEIWLTWNDADTARRVLEMFSKMDSDEFGYPEGVRLVAGPWFSNEEKKILVVLDIADHAKTFVPFGMGMAHGLIARRRMAPIVEWSALKDLLRVLSVGQGG